MTNKDAFVPSVCTADSVKYSAPDTVVTTTRVDSIADLSKLVDLYKSRASIGFSVLPQNVSIVITYKQGEISVEDLKNIHDTIKSQFPSYPVLVLPDSMDFSAYTRKDLERVINILIVAKNELDIKERL